MEGLAVKAVGHLLAQFVVMASILFIAAGSLDYWQAWVFLTVHFAASIAMTLYLSRNDVELLKRRMRGGLGAEKEKSQKIIMSLASAGFVGLLLMPGLDHRFAWSHMSPAAAVAGDLLMLLGWIAIYFVFKENTFTASTIQIFADQKVIDTGPYALIRHPMYAGGLILLLGIPIALGSWWSVGMMAVITPSIVIRLLYEERLLESELPGYEDYEKRVRFRLIPHVW